MQFILFFWVLNWYFAWMWYWSNTDHMVARFLWVMLNLFYFFQKTHIDSNPWVMGIWWQFLTKYSWTTIDTLTNLPSLICRPWQQKLYSWHNSSYSHCKLINFRQVSTTMRFLFIMMLLGPYHLLRRLLFKLFT